MADGAPPPWTFGVAPLPQALELAPQLRRVAGLIQSLEGDEPGVAQVLADLSADLDRAEADLVELAPVSSRDLAPRLGEDPPAGRRPYVDHARHVGAFNPAFPDYDLVVDGDRAMGTVTFPLAFEGPPGLVHGGVLATLFDCVIQHHNCDVGVAGKTTALAVTYRRPTPLGVALRVEIERRTDDRRITSTARLLDGDELLCTATMEAVAGDRANLPTVSPRRPVEDGEQSDSVATDASARR